MLESQIRTNDVTDKAGSGSDDADAAEKFVPAGKRSVAYQDEDMLIHTSDEGAKRYLMEAAGLCPAAADGRHPLRLAGTPCGRRAGYGPAVVSKLAETVVALECDAACGRGWPESF